MLTKCSQLAPALLTLVVDPEDPVRFSRIQPTPIRVNRALAPQSFSSASVKTESVKPGPQSPGTQVNRRWCYTANGTLFSSALPPADFRGNPTPAAEVFLLSVFFRSGKGSGSVGPDPQSPGTQVNRLG